MRMVTENRRVWESECPGPWRKCLHPPIYSLPPTDGTGRDAAGRGPIRTQLAQRAFTLQGFHMLSQEAPPGSNFRCRLKREKRTLRTESVGSLFLIGINPEKLMLKFGGGDIQLQSETGRV